MKITKNILLIKINLIIIHNFIISLRKFHFSYSFFEFVKTLETVFLAFTTTLSTIKGSSLDGSTYC
jgi:hypothetical protein